MFLFARVASKIHLHTTVTNINQTLPWQCSYRVHRRKKTELKNWKTEKKTWLNKVNTYKNWVAKKIFKDFISTKFWHQLTPIKNSENLGRSIKSYYKLRNYHGMGFVSSAKMP